MNLQAAVHRLNRAGAAVSAAALLAMLAVGVADTVSARLFNRPLAGTLELTEALMVACIFLALCAGQEEGTHIRMSLLTCRLAGRGRGFMDFLAHSLTAAFLFLVAWQGAVQGWHSFSIREYESGLVAFPLYPAKLALAAGAGLMLLQCLLDAARSAAAVFSPRRGGGRP